MGGGFQRAFSLHRLENALVAFCASEGGFSEGFHGRSHLHRERLMRNCGVVLIALQGFP